MREEFLLTPPSADNRRKLHELYNAEFKEGADKAFVDQTYDATFLALAVAKAGSADRTKIAQHCACPSPGVILPGEWARRSRLKAGKD
jgi:branched-chain amino acid transport system substrate-binding protein